MVGESGGGAQHGISPHRGEAQQGRGGGGGDEVGLTRGNPYAVLLQATKIELLETHKNTAVAKRWVFVFLLLPKLSTLLSTMLLVLFPRVVFVLVSLFGAAAAAAATAAAVAAVADVSLRSPPPF